MTRNFDLEAELQPSLSAGEILIWTGRPKTGIVFRSSDAFMIPFSLLWGGIALFWEGIVFAMGAPFIFKIWGIPFVLAGLYITIGRFVVDAKKRANTIYGITADRIIIKTGVFRTEVNSLNIKSLSDIALNQKADNSGTITLGRLDIKSSMTQGLAWPGVQQTPKIELIDDVKTVYDKIIALQKQQ